MFRPPRLAGVVTGLALSALAGGLAAALSVIGARSEPEFRTFLAWAVAVASATAAVLLLLWTFCVATLAYTVRTGSLTITWGFRRTVIGLDTVESVLPGRTVDQVRVDGLNWWGCHVGSADVRRVGFTLVYATGLDPERLVFVVTTEESYALSVTRPAAFAEEIEAHRAIGSVAPGTQRSTATGIAALPIWRDRTAMGAVVLSAVVCAIVVGFVFGQYPDLAPVVEINFPGTSDVVRVGSKQELLGIAYAAVAVLGINGATGALVHARDRAAGLWLLASGSLIEGVLLAAAVLAFGRA